MTHLRSSEHSPGELLDPGVQIWGGVSISVPGEVGATEGFKWRGVCCQVGLGGHTVTAWRTAFSLEALSQAAAEDSWEGGSQRLWVPDMGRKLGGGSGGTPGQQPSDLTLGGSGITCGLLKPRWPALAQRSDWAENSQF